MRSKKELLAAQTNHRSEDSILREAAIAQEIDKWLIREEILWKQRSRISWLSEGDDNTRFFHACANVRRRNSGIKLLQRSNGEYTSNPAEIKALIVNYYNDLFMSRQTIQKENIQAHLNVIPCKVTSRHNEILLAPYTADEVTRALFQIDPNKAPGYDGFSAAFFQHNWEIIQSDFTRECLDFLNFGQFNAVNNSTLITLIPKLKGASKVTDFRPISLTGVMAKVVSKAISNRLQHILEEIICPEQCAFLKHRLISDNVLIANEVSHFINKSRSQRHVYASLKLDMAKAFDKIEWDFLELMMKKLGFDADWVDRVLTYVHSARYCIRVNEDVSDFFYPSRGLRQGDPLSPYLFIMCTEWISYMLKYYAELGLIEGIQISRRSPPISHLLFADDCLLFMRVHSSTVKAIKYVLQCYEIISGQTVNYGKSEIALSRNCPQHIVEDINNTLGVQVVPHLSKYLGLPIQSHRKRTATFLPIIDKLWRKVNGWQNCKLSIGGKEVLISAVINAVPQYWMSTFLLPEKTITYNSKYYP
ncbi:hypothetical protein QQ045_032136 [Rhodiola kirilowii]